MKLALGVSLLSGAALVILYGIIMGIMVSGWKNSANEIASVASIQTRDTIMEVVNATLDFVMFAARSVPQLDQTLGNKMVPNSNYDPTHLLRSFVAFNELSGYKFGSFGFLMRANPPRPPLGNNAKVSWQIASGFGCPTYMYAFSDNSINPAFYGYCGQANGTVDFSRRAYTGADWGLKPLEQQLLDGTMVGAFLPVFDLLGAFTLTYEMIYDSYAVTFAELDLNTLSNHISSQVDLFNNRSVSYIYETTTGALIACNIPNTLFDGNNTRYTINNVPNNAIRETAPTSNFRNTNSWFIVSTTRTEPGLNWTIVVAVRDSYIYGNMNNSIIIASCASLGVLLFLVIVLWISIYCCVNRPLSAKKAGEPLPYTLFDEVK